MRQMRLLAWCLAALTCSAAIADDAAPSWVVDLRVSAGNLGGQLQQALLSSVENDGVVAAIEVCQHQAPAIAQALSNDQIQIGRVSLKVRNPENAPDDWEQRIMADFSRRLAAGESPVGMEVFTIRRDDQGRYGHWMKPIPTQPMCIACHGTNLAPEIAAAIDAAYPNDQARGIQPGELRGAFSGQYRFDSPHR